MTGRFFFDSRVVSLLFIVLVTRFFIRSIILQLPSARANFRQNQLGQSLVAVLEL